MEKEGSALIKNRDPWHTIITGELGVNWRLLYQKAKEKGIERKKVKKWIEAYGQVNKKVDQEGKSNKHPYKEYKSLEFFMDFAYWWAKGQVEYSPNHDFGEHLKLWGDRLLALSEKNRIGCIKDKKRFRRSYEKTENGPPGGQGEGPACGQK